MKAERCIDYVEIPVTDLNKARDFFSELFGTNVRYTGASLGYQVASPLAGGLAPLIATQLLKVGGNDPYLVAIYLITTGAITLVAVYFAGETYRSNISD